MSALFRRYLAIALLGVAVVVLLAAFVLICVRIGTMWPWTRVVHEDGQRTLLLTILYFEHASRELPLDILLGIAIGGCAYFAFGSTARRMDRPDRARRTFALGWSTALVVTVIMVGTALQGDRPMVLLENLLQHHTRPGAALVWGSHWRYHLLERIALILISISFGGLLRWLADHEVHGSEPLDGRRSARIGLGIAGSAIVVYLLLSVVFAHGVGSMLDPLRDPIYLGHQARELFTHALVTVPLAWGACLLLLPKTEWAAPTRPLFERRAAPSVVAAQGAGALGLFIGGYVCIAALRSDSISYGQTTDLAMLIFPHFFEHSFTYLVVSLVAMLVFEIAANSAAAGSTTGSTAATTAATPTGS